MSTSAGGRAADAGNLITKLGLLAGIVFHVTYNVSAFAFDRGSLQGVKQWRDYERRQRAAPKAAVVTE